MTFLLLLLKTSVHRFDPNQTLNKTIVDGRITVDIWIIKDHTFYQNSLWIIEYLGIIQFLWILKVHTSI